MIIDRFALKAALCLPVDEFRETKVLTDIMDRPSTRPTHLSGNGRIGAVLVVVYGGKKFVLTKRHSRLRHHPGQISLPGGRQEKAETLETTAIREAEEEIGIVRSEIQMIGRLKPVYIPPSDFTIFPFVAWHHGSPSFQKSDDEVAEIIEAEISPLLIPESLVQGKIEVADGQVDAQYYDVDGHRVWGATAIVLTEFFDRLRAVTS